MAADSKLTLQASVIKTASFDSAGVDLKTGTPNYGLVARVIYSAAANASGSNTVAWKMQHSDDDSTYYDLASNAENNLTLSTTAQAGEAFIPFRTSKRYVRLVLTVNGAGTSPTVTYLADIVPARP